MTLIGDLIDGASGDVPVATLLRKVKVLASRLDVGQLDTWVEHELSGYPGGDELPTYRGPWPVEALGVFSGPFGSSAKNVPIPAMNIPEKFREGLFTLELRGPISEIEKLSETRGNEGLREMWPADIIAWLNRKMSEGEIHLYELMGLVTAWKPISPAVLRSVVDQVRTRILDLALSIEKTNPSAGQEDSPGPPPEVVQTFVTNVYGGSSNFAFASSNVRQQARAVAHGDRAGLVAYLKSVGIAEADIADLGNAIDRDNNRAVDGELGEHVSSWLGRWLTKARTTAGAVGAGAAGELIALALAAYFGIAG